MILKPPNKIPSLEFTRWLHTLRDKVNSSRFTLPFFLTTGSPLGGGSPVVVYMSAGIPMSADSGFVMMDRGIIKSTSIAYSVSTTGVGVTTLLLQVLINGNVAKQTEIDKTSGVNKKAISEVERVYTQGDILSIRLSATGGQAGVNETVVTNLTGVLSFFS